MIAYIRGTVTCMMEDGFILENQGIGYRIYAPLTVLRGIQTGEERKVHIHMALREDAVTLFGFTSRDDLQLFRLLLKVSGIGPKGALSVLSALSADELRFAVLSDDAATLAKAPGIGKKTAQKLILEIKDKLDLSEAFEMAAEHTALAGEAEGGAIPDATAALAALGYANTAAFQAVKKAAEAHPEARDDVEVLLKLALKEL